MDCSCMGELSQSKLRDLRTGLQELRANDEARWRSWSRWVEQAKDWLDEQERVKVQIRGSTLGQKNALLDALEQAPLLNSSLLKCQLDPDGGDGQIIGLDDDVHEGLYLALTSGMMPKVGAAKYPIEDKAQSKLVRAHLSNDVHKDFSAEPRFAVEPSFTHKASSRGAISNERMERKGSIGGEGPAGKRVVGRRSAGCGDVRERKDKEIHFQGSHDRSMDLRAHSDGAISSAEAAWRRMTQALIDKNGGGGFAQSLSNFCKAIADGDMSKLNIRNPLLLRDVWVKKLDLLHKHRKPRTISRSSRRHPTIAGERDKPNNHLEPSRADLLPAGAGARASQDRKTLEKGGSQSSKDQRSSRLQETVTSIFAKGSLSSLCTQSTQDLSIRSVATGLPAASVACCSCITSCFGNLVMHPNGKRRALWMWTGGLLMCVDAVWGPVFMFFPMSSRTIFHFLFNWVTSIFWTVDVLMSFLTGIYVEGELEMRVKKIGIHYMRTWFMFDIVLVFVDWLSLFLDTLSEHGLASGLIRFTRVFRHVRLLRLLRFGKVSFWLQEFFLLASEGVALILTLAINLFFFIVGVHVFTCIWYGVGSSISDGWVETYGVSSFDLFDSYIISLHWILALGFGQSRIMPANSEDLLFSCIAALVCFGCVCFFVGKATYSITQLNTLRSVHWEDVWRRYLRRHQISKSVAMRVKKYLDSKRHVDMNFGELENEKKMFQSLPDALQIDLHEEVRGQLLSRSIFFDDLKVYNPRVLRKLCGSVVNSVFAVANEIVFTTGDTCARMLVVDIGDFEYFLYDPNLQKQSSLNRAGTTAYQDCHKFETASGEGLHKGQGISEAVLWTKWEHQGELVAISDGTFLSIEAIPFNTIIAESQDACQHALMYARYYIQTANLMDGLSDLMDIGIRLSRLDELSQVSPEDHFLFISHYKQEAGTEAALMQEGWERLLSDDPGHEANTFQAPCFLDSENLDDLSQLKDHVKRTHNVILLLTPGLLSRPWCLVEIVTAMEHQVPIVPVNIQRPGASFVFPDEEFYQVLMNGDYLGDSAMAVLEHEGIELETVEEAIRQVFVKIALPFSPQKSGAIRKAELLDILKRCTLKGSRDDGEDDDTK